MADATRGPWTVELETHKGPDDWFAAAVHVGSPWDGTLRTIARVPRTEHAYDEAENAEVEANARLIAAAPDLLAALCLVLEQVDDGLHQDPCDQPDCWVAAAHAAFAKTKGGPSDGGR